MRRLGILTYLILAFHLAASVAAQGSPQLQDGESSTPSSAIASALSNSAKLLRFARSFIPRNLPNESRPTSALSPRSKDRRTLPKWPSCHTNTPKCAEQCLLWYE